MISFSSMPSVSILDMQLGMSDCVVRMLAAWMSVLMVSGEKPRRIARSATGHRKLPLPCPRSKRTPRLRASYMKGWNLARSPVEQLHVPVVVEVGVQIAGPHLLQQFGAGIAPGPAEDVVVQHDRAVRKTTGFHGAFDRNEPLTIEMRILDSDDEVGILANLARGGPRIHVFDIALVPAHPQADDVDERQNSGFGTTEDLFAVVLEVAPAWTSGVRDGRRARGQRHIVGEEGAVVPVLVAVNVDRGPEPRRVPAGPRSVWRTGRQGSRDAQIRPLRMATSPNVIDPVRGIDDVATGQDQVV